MLLFFSVILPEPVENGCLDNFLLISTYLLHLFTISVKIQARLTRKIVGTYSQVFTVS